LLTAARRDGDSVDHARYADQRSGEVDVVGPPSVSQPVAAAPFDVVVFEAPPPIPWVAPAHATPFWPCNDEDPLVLPRLDLVVADASLLAEPAPQADEPALSCPVEPPVRVEPD
jgi:hypothetical protein